MAQTILAALGATICFALLVHMFLPARWRQRVDALLHRIVQTLRQRRSGTPRPVRRTDLRAANKPRMDKTGTEERKLDPKSEREVLREAEQEAQDVIERVRRQARENKPVDRDGNVYRPDAFKPRPPKDKLH